MVRQVTGITHIYIGDGICNHRWTVQDNNFIDKETGMWSYEGMVKVEDGDELSVFDGEYNIFQEVIKLVPIQHKGKEWIHKVQEGYSKEDWEYLFKDKGAVLWKND